MKQLLRLIRRKRNFLQLLNTNQQYRALHHIKPLSHHNTQCKDSFLSLLLHQGRTGTCKTLGQLIQCRGLVVTTSHGTRSNIGVGSGQHHVEEEPLDQTKQMTLTQHVTKGPSDTAWVIRLANENGFLSWCRNTYLASAVACGMQAEGTLEISQLAAQGVFLLAGINLIWGTTSFVLHVLTLRKRVQMSMVVALLNVSGAVLHLLTWLALVTMYLGLTEEEQAEQKPCEAEDI